MERIFALAPTFGPHAILEDATHGETGHHSEAPCKHQPANTGNENALIWGKIPN